MGFNEHGRDFIYKENMPEKVKGLAFDTIKRVVIVLTKTGAQHFIKI
jgi:hypothetical protein